MPLWKSSSPTKSTPVRKNPKWKKYNCVLKTDEEKLSDLYEACREGRDDIVTLLTGDEGNVDVNQIPKKEQQCQG